MHRKKTEFWAEEATGNLKTPAEKWKKNHPRVAAQGPGVSCVLVKMHRTKRQACKLCLFLAPEPSVASLA